MRRIDEYDEQYISDRIGKMTPLGLFARVVGGLLVLCLVFGVIGYFAGWFNTAVDVTRPDNVKVQYEQIYQDYQALQKGAQNICDLRAARDQAGNDDEKSQRVSQVLASQQNYNRVAATYNARWQNAFKAKYVGPHEVPTVAPDLQSLTAKIAGCAQK